MYVAYVIGRLQAADQQSHHGEYSCAVTNGVAARLAGSGCSQHLLSEGLHGVETC